jgi:precorrin-8X/cobalt-precorrin-8 methylmutase
MSTIFDSYLVVDWSAAKVPRRGKDSIWLHELRPGCEHSSNPATREQAMAALRERLLDNVAAGRRTLLGCDFAFGYPAGTAAKLGLAGTPWRALWDELAGLITDAPDNHNNRFRVAAQLNQRYSNSNYPFWGCFEADVSAHLDSRKQRPPGLALAEHRACEQAASGAQSVWKLAYTGSVGSQALMGIPRLHALRFDPQLCQHTRVWPFETGPVHPGQWAPADWRVCIAEVYPSMIPIEAAAGKVHDQCQVEQLAQHFYQLDQAGLLAEHLALARLPAGVDEQQVMEEGWILGVGQ